MARLGSGYWKLWTASTASNVGDGVVLAALPLLAADLTRDPVAVAAVTVAAYLPWLGFGLFAGVLVDRLDRRRVMWVVDAARAAVLTMLAVAVAMDEVTLTVVYAAVLLLGVGETLFDTAAQSVLPAIVGPEDLELANGRLFGAQLAANGFAGPPLGGVLFAVAAAVPFAFDAVTFAVSAVLVLTLRGSFRPRRAARTGVGADLREGLAYLWRHRVIRGFAIGAAVINVAYAGASAVLILFAQELLGLGSVGFGLLLAGAAIGGVAGTFAAAPIVARSGRSAAVLGAAAALALSLAAAGLARQAWVAAAALAVFALASEVWNVVAVSYRQAAVPDELLGRIMAGYRVVAYGAFPVGAALGGWLAAGWGLRAPFLAGAGLVAVLLAYLVPLLAGTDLRPQAAGETA